MRRLQVVLIISLLFLSCEKDDTSMDMIEEEVGNPTEEIPEESEQENSIGEILVYEQQRVQEGLVLVNDASSNRVYIIEKEKGNLVFEWNLPSGIGNDAELLPNGNLLVALTDDDPAYTFGGFGGRIAIISPQGDILWDYKYSDEVNLAHHDVEMLPNGNILFIAWEKKSGVDLSDVGYTGEYEQIYTEKVIEIDPESNQIVWEWKVWDHLIQDKNDDLDNYSEISDQPEKVNINYQDSLKDGDNGGDIFHANALEYDEENDLIYLSINYFSEVWVIDHSTTQQEAANNIGGNYGKGGDLVYRFGNPEAYNNVGERTFFHNHNPNLVTGGNSLLVYSNGLPEVDPHSVVYELVVPEIFDLKANENNELEILWSFKDPNLFSPKVSGAYRLPNGNTLITQGTFGFWEVTSSREVVWKYKGDGFFWRGYHYDSSNVAIQNLNLDL